MFLNASPQEVFRASEITAQNQAALIPSSPVLPRLLLAGVWVFVIYSLLRKGLK